MKYLRHVACAICAGTLLSGCSGSEALVEAAVLAKYPGAELLTHRASDWTGGESTYVLCYTGQVVVIRTDRLLSSVVQEAPIKVDRERARCGKGD